MRSIVFFLFIFISPFLFIGELTALPIYAARAARTCDNCHVNPYKNKKNSEWKNPPLKYRKCNLSCQGCHVNPSGGGIRTVSGRYYAKSTLPMFGAKNRPYRDINRSLINVLKNFFGIEPSPESRLNTKSKTYREKIKGNYTSEEYIERHKTEGEKYPVHFFYSNDLLSFGSPFYVASMADQSIYAFARDRYGDLNADPFFTSGFDIRIAAYGPRVRVFPMQFDAGFNLHPIEHLTLSSTVGLRGRTSGFNDTFDRNEHSIYQVQNAFLLIHELPYAAYIQSGLFLPEFGIRDDDHTAYGRKYFEMDHTNEKNLVYGIQMGMAPNYPYFSVSWFVNRSESNDKTDGYGYAANAYWRDTSVGGGINYIHKKRAYEYGGDLDAVSINGYLNLWGLFFPMRYIAPMTIQVEYNIGRKPRTEEHDKYYSTSLIRFDYLIANGVNLYITSMFYDSDWELKDDTQWRLGPGLDITLFTGFRFTANFRYAIAEPYYGSWDFIFFVHGYY